MTTSQDPDGVPARGPAAPVAEPHPPQPPSYPAFGDDGRRELLLRMYDQAWSNINRHISIVWQAVGVLVAASAVYAAVKEQIIPLDLATTLVVVVGGWVVANVYDASAWYNRNQALIVNIEQLFLRSDDLQYVHPYFAEHRKPSDVVRHLRMQLVLGLGVVVAALGYHLAIRVWPLWNGDARQPDGSEALPYIVSLAAVLYLNHMRGKARKDLEEFTRLAPGLWAARATRTGAGTRRISE